MRHDKLEQQLSLLLLLTQGRSYTVGQICDMLRLSPRNVYYYLDFFRETGFIVEKREGGYCIDRSSPFLRQLIEHIEFTEEEVIAMHRILNKVEEDQPPPPFNTVIRFISIICFVSIFSYIFQSFISC